jgi:hypothetical protein
MDFRIFFKRITNFKIYLSMIAYLFKVNLFLQFFKLLKINPHPFDPTYFHNYLD